MPQWRSGYPAYRTGDLGAWAVGVGVGLITGGMVNNCFGSAVSNFFGGALESKKHYGDLKKRIERELKSLPSGGVKKRKIAGAVYYYLQKRVGEKVVHKYLGKESPEVLIKQISQRRALKDELKKVNEGLMLVHREEGRKLARDH